MTHFPIICEVFSQRYADGVVRQAIVSYLFPAELIEIVSRQNSRSKRRERKHGVVLNFKR